MTGLTDRMRTCAAFIMGMPREEANLLLDDAARLLVEAAHEIDVLTGPIDPGEPMEVIEPGRMMAGTWVATADTLPVANPYRSRDACPTCDSRAPKRVRRVGKEMVFVCPACGLITKLPPAEGTAGGKE